MQNEVMNTAIAVKETPETILKRHIGSFRENNLDALIADYTDESVLITQDVSYSGVEEIKSFFAALMPHFPKQKSLFELDKMVIKNDLAYILWHAKTPSLDLPFATDTFIIKKGKILQQTFAGQLTFLV